MNDNFESLQSLVAQADTAGDDLESLRRENALLHMQINSLKSELALCEQLVESIGGMVSLFNSARYKRRGY